MSTKTPTLEIASVKDTLPTCTPYLMPFHIDYSGPAPVSTYFRVKPAAPPTYGQDIPTLGKDASTTQTSAPPDEDIMSIPESSRSTLVASSSSVTLGSTASSSSAETLTADVSMSKETRTSPATAPRFVAAFRGRTVHGLQVELPSGYSGMILRAPDEGSQDIRADELNREKGRAKGKTINKRNTRRSSRAASVVTGAQQDGNDSSGDHGPEGMTRMADDTGAVRTLQPASLFSSFVLWNQDIPVDEGKDEYLRSLTEWTTLAAQIHQVEEDL